MTTESQVDPGARVGRIVALVIVWLTLCYLTVVGFSSVIHQAFHRGVPDDRASTTLKEKPCP